MKHSRTYGLMETFGIEIEYGIVDARTLDPAPYADWLLSEAAGTPRACDFEDGNIGWSNELVNHVLEFKNIAPVSDVEGIVAPLQRNVRHAARLLAERDCRLLPAGMHPWMRPSAEARLWPWEAHEIYATYDRIFDCRRHGWANVQSVQINVSFHGDEEFARLHAACRLLLPLTPAIAASSPFAEGANTGRLDARLHHYRHNSSLIPMITGQVIPEPVYDEAAYRRTIFEPLFAQIAPHDPAGHLRHLFLNARGAIPRFDRGSVELRLADAQECPLADVSVCLGLVAGLRFLMEETSVDPRTLAGFDTGELSRILDAVAARGPSAEVPGGDFARCFGVESGGPVEARELWRSILGSASAAKAPLGTSSREVLSRILDGGTLAERILLATGPSPGRNRLQAVYGNLAGCVERGELFTP